MKTTLKRALALFLCLVLCFSLLPVSAFAEGEQEDEPQLEEACEPEENDPPEEGEICDHVPAEAVTENEVKPTCTEPGCHDEVVYCALCGKELSRETVEDPATGHDYEAVEAVAPTCTEPGHTAGVVCARCGDVQSGCEELPLAAHTPEEVEEIPAELGKPGRAAGVVCAVCGEILEGCEEIPALPGWEETASAQNLELDAVPGGVAINPTNFPDPIFRSYVANTYDMPPSDGNLSAQEIADATRLSLRDDGQDSTGEITTLQGIEFLTSLTSIDIHTHCTELDLSHNTALTTVHGSWNQQLKSVMLGQNNVLSLLHFPMSPISVLDVSGCPLIVDAVVNGVKDDGGDIITYTGANSDLMVSSLTQVVTGIPDGIPIDKKHFPDDVFRAYVAEIFDEDDDSVLSSTEIATATGIDVNHMGISSLSGIEYFTALTELDCSNNSLRTLDLSHNAALTDLNCSECNLAKLDVSCNTALKSLQCGSNRLTKLDVSHNTGLMWLSCENNSLTNLDISYNAGLKILDCYLNNLTVLDLKQNQALITLHCHNNKLTELDINRNTALQILSCDDNSLTELDLSHNTALISLNCRNTRLTALDLSHNTALVYLDYSYTGLPALDLSRHTALKGLSCAGNGLTALDISSYTTLLSLNCSNNSLEELDVSKNTALETLHCDHNLLSELSIENNTRLQILVCDHNRISMLDIPKCPCLVDAYINGIHILTEPGTAIIYRSVDRIDGHINILQVDLNTRVINRRDLITDRFYNRFRHTNVSWPWNAGFVGIESYQPDPLIFSRLTRNAYASEISELKAMFANGYDWHGSCHGIASTIALSYAGLLSISDINSSAARTYYDMPFPWQDSKLLSAIQFYQLIQYVSRDISRGNVRSVWNGGDLATFMEELIDYAQDCPNALLCYGYYSGSKAHGHAIVIGGYRFNEQAGTHEVLLFDENCIRNDPETDAHFIVMTIPESLDAFSFTDGNGNNINQDSFRYLKIEDASKLPDLRSGEPFSRSAGAMTNTVLHIAAGSSFRLVAQDSTYLEFDGSDWSGNMEILGIDPITGSSEDGDALTFRLEIPAGDEYVLSNIGGDEQISLSNGRDYIALAGQGISSAELSFTDGVKLNGENYSYCLTMSTDETVGPNELGLIAVKGHSSATLFAEKNGSALALSTEGTLSDTELSAMIGLEKTTESVENAVDRIVFDMYGNLLLPTVKLSQEYLAMNKGSSTKLDAEIDRAGWTDKLHWYVESVDGQPDVTNGIIQIDQTGFVTAVGAGTAYAAVEIRFGSHVTTARCRVDVVEGEAGEEHPIAADLDREDIVSGVRLVDTKATAELYKAEYTRITVLPELSRNNVSAAAFEVVPPSAPAANSGVAITAARFDDTATAERFSLRVADDRALEIIPNPSYVTTDAATLKQLKGSYKSPVFVTVDGTEYNAGTLTLTVKRSLPKIGVKAVKLNSFLVEDTQALTFTGTAAESAEVDYSPKKGKPDWLDFNAGAFTVTYRGPNDVGRSGKLFLLVKPVGWNVKLPVTVSVSAARTAPRLSVKPASVSLHPGVGDIAGAAVTVAPAAFQNADSWPLQLVSVTEGKKDASQLLGISVDGHSISIQENAAALTDGKAHTCKVTLALMRDGVPTNVRTTLTVKLLAESTKITLSAKASGAIDTAIPMSAVTVKVTPKGVNAGTVWITDVSVFRQKGKAPAEDVTESFTAEVNGLSVTLCQKEGAELTSGYSYTATIETNLGAAASAKFTVKFSNPAKVKPSATLKVTGFIDVIRPNTEVKVTPTVKNCYTYTPAVENLQIWKQQGKIYENVTQDPTRNPFDVRVENGVFVLKLKSGVNHTADRFKVSLAATMDGTPVSSPQVALTVKMGAVKLTQSTKTVTLLKTDRYSRGMLKLGTADAGLAEINWDRTAASFVSPKDKAGNPFFELKYLGGGEYAIGYAGSVIRTTKNATVKLPVYLVGNNSAKPNATLSVSVRLA